MAKPAISLVLNLYLDNDIILFHFNMNKRCELKLNKDNHIYSIFKNITMCSNWRETTASNHFFYL